MESKEKYARSPSCLCTEALAVEGLETGYIAIKGATPVCASLSWSWERKLAFNTVVPRREREKLFAVLDHGLPWLYASKRKAFIGASLPEMLRVSHSEQFRDVFMELTENTAFIKHRPF